MHNEQTDERLLAAFRGGRTAALGTLAARYERPLLGLARAIVGGRRDLACDAVQETWVRVIRFADRFSAGSSFKTWLYRIAINQCRSLLAGLREPDDAGPLRSAPASGPPPTAVPDKAEQDAELRAAVAQLDDDRRVIVLLCYHAGMTHEQAAEILELPLGTLKSRLHAALTELRQTLSKENPHERRANA